MVRQDVLEDIKTVLNEEFSAKDFTIESNEDKNKSEVHFHSNENIPEVELVEAIISIWPDDDSYKIKPNVLERKAPSEYRLVLSTPE